MNDSVIRKSYILIGVRLASLVSSLLLLEHSAEGTRWVSHESLRRVVLDSLSFVHDEYSVTLDNCIEAMSDAEDGGTLELFAD